MPSFQIDCARVLAGERGAKDALQRILARQCDWFDPEDVAAWRKAKRRKNRETVLRKQNWTCPVCKEMKSGSRQWVANKITNLLLCRSCFQRWSPKRSVTVPSLFTEERRWRFDYLLFVRARVDVGLSRAEFARRAGWSFPYQAQLEKGHVKTMDTEKMLLILKILKDQGAILTDESVLSVNGWQLPDLGEEATIEST